MTTASERFAELAKTAAAKAEDYERPRLANTGKRRRQAQEARLQAAHWRRAEAAAYCLSLAHTQPSAFTKAILAIKPTMKALEALTRSKITYSGGYYDGGTDTREPYDHDDPTTQELWTLANLRSSFAAWQLATDIARATEEAMLSKIPGFFPTPPNLVAWMIDAAWLEPHHKVLEPSCGAGNILDAIKARGAKAFGAEINHRLHEICTKKGHHVYRGDFMDNGGWPSDFDRVIMNPPFENSQDIDHVMRAFEYLKPGGRLVAIMSRVPFYRQGRKAEAFREWFSDLAGDKTDIPAGIFASSGTNIPTVMVELQKD